MLFTMGIYYKVWELEGRTQHMGKTTQVQAKHIVHGDIFSMETCRIWIIKKEYLQHPITGDFLTARMNMNDR